MADPLSDFLVFVDESGDHGMETIDKEYPLFVLAFCIIQKREYADRLTPALQSFKLKHFGHDNVVLHERDIRKVHKQVNSPGLQLADLVARPVGLSVLRPTQANRTFQVLEDKFYRNAQGKRDGWGLKCFP
ncbi:MAG: DUF3800 domain-containing protein [Nitrospira sp.]|nr:DUF3800 domain-containing protein [Nitrospira sp.]